MLEKPCLPALRREDRKRIDRLQEDVIAAAPDVIVGSWCGKPSAMNASPRDRDDAIPVCGRVCLRGKSTTPAAWSRVVNRGRDAYTR